MSKNLISEFYSLTSPFSEKDVSRALKILFDSDLVDNLDDTPMALCRIVHHTFANTIYENTYGTNLLSLIVGELMRSHFLERVAEEINEVYELDEWLGQYMNYAEEAELSKYLFYFDKSWFEKLSNDKDKFARLSSLVHFFFKNAYLYM